jgi:hypothetical protein
LLLAATAFGAEPIANPATELAWVLDYSPPEAKATVTRASARDAASQGAVLELKLGMRLNAGDVLRAGNNERIVLGLADGSEVQLDGPGEWPVPATRPSPTFLRIMQSVFGLSNEQGLVAASATTRDVACQTDPSKVVAPFLPRNQKVPAGRHSFAVGWSGGCPPFEFGVSESGRSVYKAPPTKTRIHFLEGVDLPPGIYTLHLRDGRGREDSVTLIAAGISPNPPGELAVSSTTMATVAQAHWLARHDGGAWKLEGLRVMRPLLDTNNRIALMLADGILSEPAPAQ